METQLHRIRGVPIQVISSTIPRRRRLRTCATITLAAAILLLVFLSAQDREPTYQDRTMHEWLQQHDNEHQYEALTILGTNNFPVLVKRIGYDSQSDRLLLYYRKLPSSLNRFEGVTQHLLRRSTNRTAAAIEAKAVLEIVGPEAAPVVPQLVQLAREKPFEVGDRVVHVLDWVGEPAFQALISLTDHTNRQLATEALESLNSHSNSPLFPRTITNLITRTGVYSLDDYKILSQFKSK